VHVSRFFFYTRDTVVGYCTDNGALVCDQKNRENIQDASAPRHKLQLYVYLQTSFFVTLVRLYTELQVLDVQV